MMIIQDNRLVLGYDIYVHGHTPPIDLYNTTLENQSIMTA